MRKIKFRAWNYKINKMFKVGDEFGTTHDLDCVQYFKEGQSVVLLQYTGLKDKNGVEIYEGDILRYVCKSSIETFTKPVLFKYGCFIVEENDSCGHEIAGICSDENHEGSHVGFVIGNIYENPGLLES